MALKVYAIGAGVPNYGDGVFRAYAVGTGVPNSDALNPPAGDAGAILQGSSLRRRAGLQGRGVLQGNTLRRDGR